MKRFLSFLFCFLWVNGLLAQSTLTVDSGTGAIAGPVSAATFKTGNSIQATLTLGTGVQTSLGVNVGSAGAPVLFNGAGGTPSAIALANGTGLPESGVTNLTTDLGLKAPLASPTFTGTVTLPSGQALISPALGTPASGVMTSVTGTASGLTAGNVTNVSVATTFASDLTAVPKDTGGWTEYWVTGSDFTTTNTTATTITGLTTGTLSVATRYDIEVQLTLLNAADAAGIKVAWTTTAGGSGAVISTGTTSATAAASETLAIDTLGNVKVGVSGLTGIIKMWGSIVTNGSGSPTISIQVAKVTSLTATVKVGSWLHVKKAPL